MFIEAEDPAKLVKGVPFYACPIAELDRFNARTDSTAQQSADPTIPRVVANSALKTCAYVLSQLVIDDSRYKHCIKRDIFTRIVVHAALYEAVIRALHKPPNHGYETMLCCIAKRFWLPRVCGEVFAFVKACIECDSDCISNPLPRAPLGHLPADQPFDTFYINIVNGQYSVLLVPLPKFILTMLGCLIDWAEAVLIGYQSAATYVSAVYAEWIARYNVPEQLHLDRNTQFESALFKELSATCGVDKTRITAYRPKFYGQCERFNCTLAAMLGRAVKRRPYDWKPLLAPVLQSYRSPVFEAKSFTPFRLAFGREVRLAADLGIPLPKPPSDISIFPSELTKNLQ